MGVKGVGGHDTRHLSPPLWFEDLPQSFTSVQLSISSQMNRFVLFNSRAELYFLILDRE